MKYFKTASFACAFLASFVFAGTAFAVQPTISVSADPNNSAVVDVNVYGDPNQSAILYYYSASASGPQLHSIGSTNVNGQLSTSITLTDFNITQNTSVQVLVNGQYSAGVNWPFSSTNGTSGLTLSQSSVAVAVGQSASIAASGYTSGSLYLASNSNPLVANVSIGGSTITVTGLSNGQTTANVCLLNGSSSQNCVSVYVIVQSSGAALSFSQSNVSVLSGQNGSVTISGGNGFYQVLNNSNSTVIGTALNGPTLTLSGNGTSGTSTITVCSTDMSACGVITASIGTYSSTGLSFDQTNPTVIVNQTDVINISGGFGTYYVSSNSNSSVAQTYVATSSITIYGVTPGSDSINVCSSSGACGTISVTVSGSTGGKIALNQNNLGLVTGQVLSVSVTGGTAPYSVIPGDNFAQYSLSGNIITITGIAPGISSANICSSAGGCIVLNTTVTGGAVATSGSGPYFSQNNVSVNASQNTSIALSGAGGYYVSTNTNPSAVSASVSGSSIVIFGLAAGSANISVCQSGGSCATLFVNVASQTTTTTTTSGSIAFDSNSVSVAAGKSYDMNAYAPSAIGYYVSYISDKSIVSVYVNGSKLIINGLAAGSASVSVCSSAGACGTFSVVVGGSSATASASGYVFTTPLAYGDSGTAVTELQLKLTSLGVYSGPVTGYYGSLTESAVKTLQAEHGLQQLGSVGPGTRAVLNGQ